MPMMAHYRKTGVIFLTIFLAGTTVVSHGEPESAGKNAVYYNKTGWEHLGKNDTLKAIINFKQALQRNPRYREALIGLGNAYLQTEAYDEASKLFEDALRLDRKNAEAMTGLGFALAGSGRYTDALALFEKAADIAGSGVDAYYGIATIYHGLGKDLWARRKLESVFRVNPFHYDSLLLMAEIKERERRPDEAKEFIEKAIHADPEKPEGYVRYGKILLARHMKTGDPDLLADAVTEFNNALGKQENNFSAGRYLGFISLLKNDHTSAVDYFTRARNSFPGSLVPMYNLAVAFEKGGDHDASFRSFAGAFKKYPYDSLLQARFEDFLVENEIKTGNPSRVMLSEKHFEKAGNRMKGNLSDQAIFHLRRSILLNPLRMEARNLLKDYFLTQDYYRFYVNELKDLARIFPEEGYREKLNIALIKRRERLYYRAGFSPEDPPRDVPRVLVLDFNPEEAVSTHFDAGRVVANHLSFAMGQYGRMTVAGPRERSAVAGFVYAGDDYLDRNIEKITDLIGEEKLPAVDYLVYGTYREGNQYLSTNFKIMNFHSGVVIGDFNVSETGHDNLSKLVLRAARRIYDFLPYKGRVLKIGEEDAVVNLGLFDGVSQGDLLAIFRKKSGALPVQSKILLKVSEADTLVAAVTPVNAAELNLIELNDAVYPLQKRRAKKIE